MQNSTIETTITELQKEAQAVQEKTTQQNMQMHYHFLTSQLQK